MTTTLYIADLADPTYDTPAVDLNGFNSGFAEFTLLQDFDLGEVPTEADWLVESPHPGGVQVSRRHPIVSMQFRVRANGTLDEITTAAKVLKQNLDRAGVIVFREQSTGPPLKYIDYFPSPLSQMFRGQERSLYKIIHLLDDVDGMPLTIWRHPYIREAQRDASQNLVTNSLLLEDAANNGRPDGWAWVSESNITDHAISWGVHRLGPAYTFTIATTATRTLRQVVTPAAVGEEWTFSFEGAGGPDANLPAGRAVIEFLTSGDVLIGSEQVGSLTFMKAIENGWTRAEVTATAPATTAKIRVGMRVENGSASAIEFSLRNAQAEIQHSATPFRASPTLITNDVTATNGKRLWVYNPGNVPAVAQIRTTPDSGASIVREGLATRSGYRDTTEFANVHAGFLVRAASCTLSNGTADAADASSTSSTCAETTFSTSSLKKRWRRESVAVAETALQGAFHVFTAVSGAISGEYDVQLRYGPGDTADLPYALDAVRLDTTDATAREYETLKLGTIQLDRTSSGLYLEGWAKRLSGSGTLRWDSVWLMPADEQFSQIVLPGQEEPILTKTDSWIGSQLVLPTGISGSTFVIGELVGADMVLRPTTDPSGFLEAAGTPPDTGFELVGAIQHTITATMTVFENAAAGIKQGELRVYDLTAGSQSGKVNLRGIVGNRWSNGILSPPLTFTAVAGHLYQYYGVYTSGMALGQGNIHILKISDTYTPPIVGTPSQTIAMDGDARRVYTREAGAFSSPLALSDGGILEIPPGAVLLRASLGDNPGVGHLNPKHVPTRTATVAVNIFPRNV